MIHDCYEGGCPVKATFSYGVSMLCTYHAASDLMVFPNLTLRFV